MFECFSPNSQILYVYTPELYPTTLRTRGLAFCNLTGYVGAFFAPFIPEVMVRIKPIYIHIYMKENILIYFSGKYYFPEKLFSFILGENKAQ